MFFLLRPNKAKIIEYFYHNMIILIFFIPFYVYCSSANHKSACNISDNLAPQNEDSLIIAWDNQMQEAAIAEARSSIDSYIGLGVGQSESSEKADSLAKLCAFFDLSENIILHIESIQLLIREQSGNGINEEIDEDLFGLISTHTEINLRDVQYKNIGLLETNDKFYTAFIAKKNIYDYSNDYVNEIKYSDNYENISPEIKIFLNSVNNIYVSKLKEKFRDAFK